MKQASEIASYWFLAGVAGWFLLTYVLQLGKGGAIGTLVYTFILWLVMIDVVAIIQGQVMMLREPPSWRMVCLFVVLPYALGGLRVYWLIRRRRRRRAPSSSDDVRQVSE